jgi:catechol 2,3-dioxygenase-like lactoylglutathione lyase family enzyme
VESLIAKLVSRYESGSLSRRDLIRGLAMLSAVAAAPASSSAAASADFQFLHLEHVSIAAEDPEKLSKFYIDLLGLVRHADRPDGAIRLGLPGSERTFIVFRKGPVTKIIDHFAVAVEPFNKAALKADFARRNIPTFDEAEFLVRDPEGVYCQLMADQSKR